MLVINNTNQGAFIVKKLVVHHVQASCISFWQRNTELPLRLHSHCVAHAA